MIQRITRALGLMLVAALITVAGFATPANAEPVEEATPVITGWTAIADGWNSYYFNVNSSHNFILERYNYLGYPVQWNSVQSYSSGEHKISVYAGNTTGDSYRLRVPAVEGVNKEYITSVSYIYYNPIPPMPPMPPAPPPIVKLHPNYTLSTGTVYVNQNGNVAITAFSAGVLQKLNEETSEWEEAQTFTSSFSFTPEIGKTYRLHFPETSSHYQATSPTAKYVLYPTPAVTGWDPTPITTTEVAYTMQNVTVANAWALQKLSSDSTWVTLEEFEQDTLRGLIFEKGTQKTDTYRIVSAAKLNSYSAYESEPVVITWNDKPVPPPTKPPVKPPAKPEPKPSEKPKKEIKVIKVTAKAPAIPTGKDTTFKAVVTKGYTVKLQKYNTKTKKWVTVDSSVKNGDKVTLKAAAPGTSVTYRFYSAQTKIKTKVDTRFTLKTPKVKGKITGLPKTSQWYTRTTTVTFSVNAPAEVQYIQNGKWVTQEKLKKGQHTVKFFRSTNPTKVMKYRVVIPKTTGVEGTQSKNFYYVSWK